MTNQNNEITSDQITSLMREAGEAGDLAQVAICRKALDGDDDAIAECARVLAEAASMDEED